jgi:hypothetical protein
LDGRNRHRLSVDTDALCHAADRASRSWVLPPTRPAATLMSSNQPVAATASLSGSGFRRSAAFFTLDAWTASGHRSTFMRDYRGRTGIELRSRRRISRGRVAGFVALIVVVAVAVSLWWQKSRPVTNASPSSETPREPTAKGVIPLKIPGQTQEPAPGASD